VARRVGALGGGTPLGAQQLVPAPPLGHRAGRGRPGRANRGSAGRRPSRQGRSATSALGTTWPPLQPPQPAPPPHHFPTPRTLSTPLTLALTLSLKLTLPLTPLMPGESRGPPLSTAPPLPQTTSCAPWAHRAFQRKRRCSTRARASCAGRPSAALLQRPTTSCAPLVCQNGGTPRSAWGVGVGVGCPGQEDGAPARGGAGTRAAQAVPSGPSIVGNGARAASPRYTRQARGRGSTTSASAAAAAAATAEALCPWAGRLQQQSTSCEPLAYREGAPVQSHEGASAVSGHPGRVYPGQG